MPPIVWSESETTHTSSWKRSCLFLRAFKRIWRSSNSVEQKHTREHTSMLFADIASQLRGFAKLKKIQKIREKNLERANPTHPPHPNFFGNPQLTWTEHSNHNNQQLLVYIYRQNTHGILLQNISTGLGLFWEDFQKKKKNSHPLTSIVISDCWNFVSLQSP